MIIADCYNFINKDLNTTFNFLSWMGEKMIKEVLGIFHGMIYSRRDD